MSDERVDTFASVTGSERAVAARVLKAYNGDLDAAVDGFFDGTMESRVAAYDAGALGDDDDDDRRAHAAADAAADDDDAMVISDGDQPAVGRRGRGSYDEVSDDEDEDEDYEQELERSDDEDDGIDLMSDEDDDDDDARVIREVEAARVARAAHAHEPLRPRRRAFAGYAPRDASAIPAFVTRDGGQGGYVGGDGGDEAGFDLPDGIDREEAKMLEAAMLGIAYVPPDRRRMDFGPSAPAPASVVAARSITNETDRAYEESLRADREKAAKARAEQVAKEMFEAERAAEEARVSAEAEAEEFARAKLAEEAAEALPDEPEATDEGVLNIAFKMPDGSRIMRRFLMSHTAKALFLFIDGYEKLHADSSRLAVVPGKYRLVAQHPRRVIENNDAGTIEDVGLTHKQEALMIDLL